jgi:PrtD family type I secretion system ABC transporter
VLAAAASLVLNLALLVPALYMLQVFDRVFASGSVETLVMLSLLVAVALALGYAMDVARARALSAAGPMVDRQLSAPALRSLVTRAAQPGAARDGEALRDIASLRAFLSGTGVLALFDAPWVPIYLAVITAMHPWLGTAATAGALTLFGLAVLTDRATRATSEQVHDDAGALQRRAQMLVRHAETIAGLGMAGNVVTGWQPAHARLLADRGRLGARAARYGAIARVTRQALQATLLGLGAWLVIGTQASPGIMVASTILLGRALQPVEQLIAGWRTLVGARAAWLRLSEPDSAAADKNGLALPAPRGEVVLERAMFAPGPQRPALIKNVSFTLAPGESLGVLGASGAGKTTLLRLILGVWKPTSGCVRLDGADITHWDRDALGAHIGYLPQDVELFTGSVAANIARLGPVDPERVVAAALLAQAHALILRLPNGYDTEVGDGGLALSGGQRQRIALARALYGAPRLVVLDEPSAHLDADGETALASVLRTLQQRGVTVIVVSHRPALIPQLDKLAVLKDGVLEAYAPTANLEPHLRPGARRTTTLELAPAAAAQAIR